jgi:PIN domain nuclease of toxin-antitoxin system
VNYAEVVSKLLERGVTPILMREALDNTNVKVVAFGADLAERTGLLRLQTRHLGLSLGDRACLALAEREGIPALTADRSWIGALSGIDIRAIR